MQQYPSRGDMRMVAKAGNGIGIILQVNWIQYIHIKMVDFMGSQPFIQMAMFLLNESIPKEN